MQRKSRGCKFFILVFASIFCSSLIIPVAHSEDTLFKPESSCIRYYIYHNRTMPMDSGRRQDGEGLRTLFKKNTEAEKMLNDYQSTQKSSYWPAAFGTLGVLMGIGGSIAVSNEVNPGVPQRNYRLLVVGSSILVVLGSYFYGQWRMHSNEKTLQRAIDTYNNVSPQEEKIRVGFEATTQEAGGQMKTQVSF